MKQGNYLSNNFRKIYGVFQKNLFLRDFKNILYYVDLIILLFIVKPKKIKSQKKKILVIYNMAFGDGVIWRCTSVHLNKLYPKENYEITLLCQKGINKLYENDDTYDHIIPLDFTKGTISLPERIKNFKKIREVYYDLVIDPIGIVECTTNVLMTRAAVGTEKIGLIDKDVIIHCPRHMTKKIYNKIIEVNGKGVSLIDYYAIFLKKLSNDKLDLNVGYEKIKTYPTKIKLPEKYFVVFPSASMKLKRWDISKYVELSGKIHDKTKMPIVLVGTVADKEAIDQFKKNLKVPFVDLVQKTNLNDYINIIKKAELVITNDTSAYHIAVIEETPVAIITGGYTYDRYVEYKFERMNEFKKPCIIVNEMSCFNCGNRCPNLKKENRNWPCLENITVDFAWKKIEKMINDGKIGE
ncbi:MAG: glycosyltransferase family 9 protein [Bacilli bacterium]|nr:glycosyltransferase family 9 protein [Bacilli bacterium]